MRPASEDKSWRYVTACGVFGILSLCLLSASAQEISGKVLFLKNCSACHQVDGQGIPDAFPALAGNASVQGNASNVASLLLTGRSGMPNFSQRLNDQDIAAIVGYVRNAWGNKAPDIAPERVAALRAELNAGAVEATPQNNRH